MAVMCTSVVALLVQASVWPKVGAAKDTYQQLVAVQVTMTGTSMQAPSTSSRQQPEKTGGQRFGGWSVNHGIGCALVNAAAAAAGESVIHDNDCGMRGAPKRLAQLLALRAEAVNGVQRLCVGIGSSSELVHTERVAAAGSAAQCDDHARQLHALDVLRAVQRLLDASSTECAGGSRLAEAACLADVDSAASSELGTAAASCV